MRILLTGCCGFIGSNLYNRFTERGFDFLGIDNLEFGYKENLIDTHHFVQMPFEDINQVTLDGFDILIHLACANIIYSQENCLQSFQTNTFKTFNLFKNFKGKIIYTSTASVYGQAQNIPTNEDEPTNITGIYDQSKRLTEMYLQFRCNQTTLRLSNVYGKNQRPDYPYSGVIGKLIGNAIQKKPFQINGKGLATRDYTYIEDVIRAIERAIELPAQNRPINIGTGKETNALEIAYKIAEIMKVPFNVNLIADRSIDNIKRRCMDICCAHELLGWEPLTDIDTGIKLTIKELRNGKLYSA